MEPKKFLKAIEELKQAGADVNSAYYTEGIHDKYNDEMLWKAVKTAERVGNDVLSEFAWVESKEESKESND
jgi:hypothetical protein